MNSAAFTRACVSVPRTKTRAIPNGNNTNAQRCGIVMYMLYGVRAGNGLHARAMWHPTMLNNPTICSYIPTLYVTCYILLDTLMQRILYITETTRTVYICTHTNTSVQQQQQQRSDANARYHIIISIKSCPAQRLRGRTQQQNTPVRPSHARKQRAQSSQQASTYCGHDMRPAHH